MWGKTFINELREEFVQLDTYYIIRFTKLGVSFFLNSIKFSGNFKWNKHQADLQVKDLNIINSTIFGQRNHIKDTHPPTLVCSQDANLVCQPWTNNWTKRCEREARRRCERDEKYLKMFDSLMRRKGGISFYRFFVLFACSLMFLLTLQWFNIASSM